MLAQAPKVGSGRVGAGIRPRFVGGSALRLAWNRLAGLGQFGKWPERTVGAELAALSSWAVVAAWNLVMIAVDPYLETETRVAHLAFDIGHSLALGVAFAALAACLRYARRRLRGAPVLVGTLMVALLGKPLLIDDLQGAIENLGGDPEQGLLTWIVCAAAASLVPLSAVAGRRLRGLRLRWLGVLLGLGGIVFNPFVLQSGYPSIHFLIATSAAMLIASSLLGRPLRLPGLLTRRSARILGWASVTTAASLSLAIPPSNAVQVAMQQRDTAFIAPYFTREVKHTTVANSDLPEAWRPWFEPRDKTAMRAPVRNNLLPQGGIVILVTIDALRYELMERKNRKHLPNLHALREKSLSFTQVRSPGSDTRFSLGGLFTGRYYSMLEWTRPTAKRPTLEGDPLPRLPELLSSGGVKTAQFNTLPLMLTPQIGLVRGFQSDFLVPRDSPVLSAEVMVNAAIERLKRDASGPLFIYMHLIEPHAPYSDHDKPASGKYQRYLREVEYADQQVGRLIRAVRELGLEDRTAFMVSADHGEGFGEKGVHYHNKTVYDVVVHVPLMVRLPRTKPNEVNQIVSLIDLGPTILDLFRIPTPDFWMMTLFAAARV